MNECYFARFELQFCLGWGAFYIAKAPSAFENKNTLTLSSQSRSWYKGNRLIQTEHCEMVHNESTKGIRLRRLSKHYTGVTTRHPTPLARAMI